MDPGEYPGRTDPVGNPLGGLDFRIAPGQSLTLNGNIFHVQMRIVRLPIPEVDGFLPSMRFQRPAHRVVRSCSKVETAVCAIDFHR